jgi:hypothetical protein
MAERLALLFCIQTVQVQTSDWVPDNCGFLSFSSILAVKWWEGTSNQAMTIPFRLIIQKMSYFNVIGIV